MNNKLITLNITVKGPAKTSEESQSTHISYAYSQVTW